MNALQSLFTIDERVTPRKRSREVFLSSIYALLTPSQILHYAKWRKSIQPGKTPYGDEMPWITFSAIDFLQELLTPDALVFEYGSGGSTLFFAKHAKQVVSVEHHGEWYKLLKKEIVSRKLKNITYLHKPGKKAEKSGHEYFRSTTEPEVGFKEYVTSIDGYEDNYFDLISIDGRSRVACVREAYNKIKSGGYILLDNSNRKDYFEAYLFLRKKGCVPQEFFGLLGYETILGQTTLWRVSKTNP